MHTSQGSNCLNNFVVIFCSFSFSSSVFILNLNLFRISSDLRRFILDLFIFGNSSIVELLMELKDNFVVICFNSFFNFLGEGVWGKFDIKFIIYILV